MVGLHLTVQQADGGVRSHSSDQILDSGPERQLGVFQRAIDQIVRAGFPGGLVGRRRDNAVG